MNSKAVCVTDTDVLEELKCKKAEKVEVEQAIAARKLNREKKKQEREEEKEENRKEREKKKAEREKQKMQKKQEKEEKKRES